MELFKKIVRSIAWIVLVLGIILFITHWISGTNLLLYVTAPLFTIAIPAIILIFVKVKPAQNQLNQDIDVQHKSKYSTSGIIVASIFICFVIFMFMIFFQMGNG